MIFVTVGTQGPFDRLIAAVDEIAATMPDVSFVAQVSNGTYKAKHMESFEFMGPNEFDSYFSSAQLIVSHAGMGTIISAFERNKPIVVLPKLQKFGEHRNDHQMATAKRLDQMNYLHAAYDLEQLKNKITGIVRGELNPLHRVGKYASSELINSLQEFMAVSAGHAISLQPS